MNFMFPAAFYMTIFRVATDLLLRIWIILGERSLRTKVCHCVPKSLVRSDIYPLFYILRE